MERHFPSVRLYQVAQNTKIYYRISTFPIIVNCCILRHCYPTQNLDTAINIYIFKIMIDISLNIHNYVLYGMCHLVNISDVLFFQFKPLMKV